MDTKACNLTEEEIKSLLIRTGDKFGWPNADFNELIERINYLNKRLKAFNEPNEDKPKSTMTDTQSDTINAAVASNPAPKGW